MSMSRTQLRDEWTKAVEHSERLFGENTQLKLQLTTQKTINACHFRILTATPCPDKAKDDAIDKLRAEIQRLYGIIERRDTQLLKSQEHRSRMLDNAAKQDREIEKLKQRPIDIETGLPYVGKCPPMPKVKELKKDTKTHGQVMQQLTEILATTRDCLFVGDMEGWPEGEVEELTKSGILEFKFPPIGLPSLKMWRINYMERMGIRYPAEKVEGLESIKWDGKTKLSEQSDEIEKLREDVDRIEAILQATENVPAEGWVQNIVHRLLKAEGWVQNIVHRLLKLEQALQDLSVGADVNVSLDNEQLGRLYRKNIGDQGNG